MPDHFFIGMLPLLLTGGEAAALWQPLALIVISGLTISTALTLLVLPCVYHVAAQWQVNAWWSAASQVPSPSALP